MASLLMDITISTFQAIVFSVTIACCLDNKIDRSRLAVASILLLVINISFTTMLGNFSVCVFFIHIFSLIVLMFIYNKNRLESITSYTLSYCFMDVYSIFVGNLFFGYLKSIIPVEYNTIIHNMIVIVPLAIFIVFYLKYMDKVIQIYKFIRSEKQSTIVVIMISFILDFVVAFYVILYQNENILLKSIIATSLSIFIICILIYFIRIKKKADEIFKLNKVLETKNSELRKIKNKHVAEVSYLYGLHCMNRWDELGKTLKGIINNSSNISNDRDDIENCRNSMLALCLKQARDRGIRIILEDNCDISSVDMKEIELYRVISNIINNAVKAMNGSGIIIVKTYYELENVVIKIENNGPKIPKANINDIFKAGFTTKRNIEGNHGYGLSIVKELIEACRGKIAVKSTDISTEFEIILPLKKL